MEEESSSSLVGVSRLLSTPDGRTDGGRGQAGLLVDLNASFLFSAASLCLWLVLVMVCLKGGGLCARGERWGCWVCEGGSWVRVGGGGFSECCRGVGGAGLVHRGHTATGVSGLGMADKMVMGALYLCYNCGDPSKQPTNFYTVI